MTCVCDRSPSAGACYLPYEPERWAGGKEWASMRRQQIGRSQKMLSEDCQLGKGVPPWRRLWSDLSRNRTRTLSSNIPHNSQSSLQITATALCTLRRLNNPSPIQSSHVPPLEHYCSPRLHGDRRWVIIYLDFEFMFESWHVVKSPLSLLIK